jgi:predicted XRE-type DNA-binding protein
VAKLPLRHVAATVQPSGVHWNTSLTESLVQNVRQLLTEGVSQDRIAATLGIGQSSVSRIKRGVDTISAH